ncbi:hypothetical protein BJL95_23450 [Methylomonas sp. LWB]|nr:hypothetical protein BJL95_23450 [Methylomonas sp. LWB]
MTFPASPEPFAGRQDSVRGQCAATGLHGTASRFVHRDALGKAKSEILNVRCAQPANQGGNGFYPPSRRYPGRPREIGVDAALASGFGIFQGTRVVAMAQPKGLQCPSYPTRQPS